MLNRVLIVDDSLAARMIIKQHLRIAGCASAEFIEAKNGKEALEQLKDTRIDLVVTDMNMPEMNGSEFIGRLKASPRYHNIPIIIISSAVKKDSSERFMKFGANFVIGKPISPHELYEAINSLSGNTEE